MKRTNLPALIILLLLCAVSQGAFKFVAWADNRPYDDANRIRFVWMLQQMNLIVVVGSEPLFHVVPGDYDYTSITDADIADVSLIKKWYGAIGNHDRDRGESKGNESMDLPSGTPQARFLFLDEYQCPDGVCDCYEGRVCEHALAWLETECLSTPEGFPIFVVGHEPAYPANRHVGDSLDANEPERDAFWALLGKYGATYICGHTHYYSTYSSGGATQIDVGNAGNPGESQQTFVVFTVNDDGSVDRAMHTTEYNVSAYPPATNPLPANGATGLSTTPVLTWTAGSGATSHEVYFGPVADGLPATPKIVTDSSCRIKDIPDYTEGLNYETPYAWRVDVVYDTKHTTRGQLWTFTTKEEFAVRYAVGETTIDGSVSGDIDGTEHSDNVYEQISEALSNPGKNGYGVLEHIWRFENVPAGDYVQLRIEAYRSKKDLTDNFELSYSTNGSSYSLLGYNVEKVSDDNIEDIIENAINLPSVTNNTVWIKVKNTELPKGSKECDILFVDSLYIVSFDEVSGNRSPVANAGPDKTVPDGESVTIDGSESDDPDGSIVKYEWADEELRVLGNGDILTYSFLVGTHTVTLTVTDDGGLSDSDEVLITVQAAGSTMHIHDIIMSSKAAGPNLSGIATIWIIDTSGADVEGATVYGTWSGIVGGAASSVTGVDGKVTLQSPKVKSSGTFTFTVDDVVKSGWTYDPAGVTSGSITIP